MCGDFQVRQYPRRIGPGSLPWPKSGDPGRPPSGIINQEPVEGGGKRVKSITEQMAENRRISQLQSIESERKREGEREFFRGKLAYIQNLIREKPASEARKMLEQFIDIEGIADQLVFFIDHNTDLYPRKSEEKIRKDMTARGGAIPFFKVNQIKLRLFTMDGYGWLLHEIAKIYDFLMGSTPPEEIETTKKKRKRKTKERYPLKHRMNWKGDDEEIEQVLSRLRGVIQYDSLEDAMCKGDITLKGKNKQIDAIAIMYTLAKLGKVTIDNYYAAQIESIFSGIESEAIKSWNDRLLNPLKMDGINDSPQYKSSFPDIFQKRLEEIEKILSFLKK